MGEVIEINIVSGDKSLLSKFMSFISLQMEGSAIRKIVEVMDNWQYENVKTIDSIELLKPFIGNKIICITEIKTCGQVGISVEPIDALLLYNVWFNLTLLSHNEEYFRLIDDFIEYLSKSEAGRNIIIGAIGKETKFEYLGNNKETISSAHNVDVWLLDKIHFQSNVLEKHKILTNISSKNADKELFVLYKL